MNDGFYSPNWFRVAKLKPRLHPHVRIHRHEYRDLIWYLFEDTTINRSYRFNSESYQFIGLLDGVLSVEEIYETISERLGDFVPGQEDIIEVLIKLNSSNLISTDAVANTEELFSSQVSNKHKKIKQNLGNPISIKVPLWDPDKFLNKHFNKVKWLFSKWAGAAWLLLMAYALFKAIEHWPKITQHFGINALSTNNVLLMIVLYPIIKIIHEFGHGFSAKLEGGEVHELGVNFMLFMPIPYVNVSTATYFRNKYKRIFVSAAGILVESFLAAMGLLLFLATEPGWVNDIGFTMFIIGGISSIFFNGNPLLKFDGYYILADLLAIPNLYQRSAEYWIYLFKRYLFRIESAITPAQASGEPAWFMIYGLLSQAYRLCVLWFIISMASEVSLLAGVVLAIWLIGMQIGVPLWKALRFISNSPSLLKNRGQSWSIVAAIAGSIIVFLGLIPVPSYTITEGVVWQPDNAQLIAAEEGFARTPLVDNNQIVEAGTTVLQLDDPFLNSEQRVARAKLQELETRYQGNRIQDQVQAEIIKDEIRVAKSNLDYLGEKSRSMTVKAAKTGKLLLPEASDLAGRFIRKGDLIGYILEDKQPLTVRMAVIQDHIGQLRNHFTDVHVRFVSEPENVYQANIIRQTPEAINQLPSAALSIHGGGKFIVDPTTNSGTIITEKVFLVDLEISTLDLNIPLGTRAYIRIGHGAESVASQLYRRIRQTFLRQLNV